ncbi:MAG: hypothetical protein GY796_24760 [Chloroflexi bacterium]|nr:hypothetical protein [Chloroflexota bacterium]
MPENPPGLALMFIGFSINLSIAFIIVRFLYFPKERIKSYMFPAIFTSEQMAARYNALAEMIAPYAESEIGVDAFETAVSEFINHVNNCQEAAETYLATQQ